LSFDKVSNASYVPGPGVFSLFVSTLLLYIVYTGASFPNLEGDSYIPGPGIYLSVYDIKSYLLEDPILNDYILSFT
jgi:hypothetical protein